MANKAEVLLKVTVDGKQPKQAYPGDVGTDIYTAEDVLIYPGALRATIIPTGLSTAFDEINYGMLIAPRSSILKYPLSMSNSLGVIEGTYRGDLGIVLRHTLSGNAHMLSNHALAINEETGELEPIHIKDIPAGALRKAKEQYMKEYKLLNPGLNASEVVAKTSEMFISQVIHTTLFIPKGTRIAQMFLFDKVTPEYKLVGELPQSVRGEKGFGSSGATK